MVWFTIIFYYPRLIDIAGNITSVHPNSGPVAGGTRVTITGSGLGYLNDITQVLIVGNPATIISQDEHTVVVVTAASSANGTGNVEVQSAALQSTVASEAFTYNPGM